MSLTGRKCLRIVAVIAVAASGLWGVNGYRHRLVGRGPTRSRVAALILASSKLQIGTHYDASYHRLAYPGGDVPARTGACTDIVIRAVRAAGWDLQERVHRDMLAAPSAYPRLGKSGPDTSIDHRRAPNLRVFFRRHAIVLPIAVNPNAMAEWQPGDIVCWKTVFGRDHIGIVSDGTDASGLPFVIHNEYGCVEESCLTRWRIVDHFRLPNSQSNP